MNGKRAIDLGIWAINTILHPEGSTQEQFDVLDKEGEAAVERLAKIRDGATIGEHLFGEDKIVTLVTRDDDGDMAVTVHPNVENALLNLAVNFEPDLLDEDGQLNAGVTQDIVESALNEQNVLVYIEEHSL